MNNIIIIWFYIVFILFVIYSLKIVEDNNKIDNIYTIIIIILFFIILGESVKLYSGDKKIILMSNQLLNIGYKLSYLYIFLFFYIINYYNKKYKKITAIFIIMVLQLLYYIQFITGYIYRNNFFSIYTLVCCLIMFFSNIEYNNFNIVVKSKSKIINIRTLMILLVTINTYSYYLENIKHLAFINIININFSIYFLKLTLFYYELEKYYYIYTIMDGFLLINKKGVIYFAHNNIQDNSSISKSLKGKNFFGIFETIDNIKSLKDFAVSIKKPSIIKVKTELEGKIKYYKLKLSKINYLRHGFIGWIIAYSDITEEYLYKHKLQKKVIQLKNTCQAILEQIKTEQEVSLTLEQNKFAQELHDILGSSITLAISMLEYLKHINDKEIKMNYIKELKQMTKKSIQDLKTSMTQERNKIKIDEIYKELRLLLNQYSLAGIDIDFIFKVYIEEITFNAYKAIIRLCQESITNAIRHGKANEITIIIRTIKNNLQIIICDNGEGCINIVDGNGLKGIKKRIKQLNGTVKINNYENEGLTILVYIPFKGNVIKEKEEH